MRLPVGERAGAVLLQGVVGILGRTWRYEIEGWHHVERLRRERRTAVYLVWHGRLLPVTYRHRNQGVAILVSRHRDGGFLAETAGRWGYTVVRGSTRRGGAQGLLGIIRLLREGREAALTPDGPQGPAERVQPGAVVAAQHAEVPIVAIGAGATRAWWIRSWDRFLVPQPFARVRVVYSEPIDVSRGASGLVAGIAAAQRALDEVTARA